MRRGVVFLWFYLLGDGTYLLYYARSLPEVEGGLFFAFYYDSSLPWRVITLYNKFA